MQKWGNYIGLPQKALKQVPDIQRNAPTSLKFTSCSYTAK